MDCNGLLMGSLQVQCGIVDLANKLRQERLFVTSEQQHLQTLNEKVVSVSSRLAELAWVTAQQRDNLNCLIVARPDCSPASCCQKANTLENTRFVDGIKILGFQECMTYGEFLQSLRTSPQLLASCLVAGDRLVPNMMHGVIHSLAAGLFGSSLLHDDKVLVLRLLQHLTRLQLVPSDNPRRLLRKKCCAFARLYAEFHESLFSAKLFLTAALHYPIMKLLVDHDIFLDIDPDKATIRFSAEDRLKRFGVEGTPEYDMRLHEYRQWTISRLVAVTGRFLSSLRENMHCFPTGVCWLVRQIASLLSKSNNIQPKEVSAICTDLVFTHFICPAIVNPEPYGITDAPISYIARFNLIQVAKIIQTLAMTRYEEIDPKLVDLYSQFDKNCVSCLLDTILNSDSDELEDGPAMGSSTKLQGLARSAALFTGSELNNLVSFLQAVASDTIDTQLDKKQLADLLQQLPSVSPTKPGPQQFPSSSNTPPDINRKISGLLGKVGKSRARASASEGSDERIDNDDGHGEDVLVIPFSTSTRERVGFLPEQKVLSMGDTECQIQVNLTDPPLAEGGVDVAGGSGSGGSDGQEKRTRALSHDDGSIGNTSDNLEAVSEAASNHSVASSLELETEDQNDNLSDMVSANVSGRGTPNISGRDTPSSQITEGDDGVGVARGAGGEPRQLDFRPPSTTTKQSRSDIDDKFCKFEIKKLLEGDETVMSMVSDTWSTDVLASDSETVEQPEPLLPRLLPPDPEVQLLDVSETASEAWSIDVLASDTERLMEVDTDDTGSVARSDDMARSEVEDTPPPNLALGVSSGFRPIRDSPLVPASPTRVDVHGVWNVTGRGGGKADYRRRVVEYVDNNRRDRENQPNLAHPAPMRSIEETRLMHVIDKIDKPPDTKPPPVPLSLAIPPSSPEADNSTISVQLGVDLMPPLTSVTRADLSLVNGAQASLPLANGLLTSSNHVAPRLLPSSRQSALDTNEIKLEGLHIVDDAVRLSSASLTSTSSSGSGSDPRLNTVTPTPDLHLAPAAVLVNGHADKPVLSLSTGAIPKSISFDKTAERGDKELLDDDQKQKRSFFRNFKLPFKNRRGKSLRGSEDLTCRYESTLASSDNPIRLRRGVSDDGRCLLDTSEDILAKYRRKPIGDGDLSDMNASGDPKVKRADDVEDVRLTIDPLRVEESYAFSDAKRKLRMVLSTADLQHNHSSQNHSPENELVLFLQLQLAEAINLQDRPLVAHLHETLRCIRLFNADGCRKLFNSLKEDYQKRAPYIGYLVRCRQGLLSTLAHLDRLTERVKSDRDVCSRFLVAVCVSLFLERRDAVVQRFIVEFQQLTLADEKMDMLDGFLHQLAVDMEQDATWLVASDSQLEQARTAVERAMMSRVYMNALYPNGDGDISRDQVLHDHMAKLSIVVTPNHKDLRIPNRFQYECPWASAQAEVSAIAAYKTPRDKLQCILRCTTTIMNLLAMADIPAADDFTPVLVYVLIKANPPALLSTIQYIDSFYANRLEGEDQYWWIQFCSSVEFIKTMDYTD